MPLPVRKKPLVDAGLLFPFLVWRFSEFASISVGASELAPITSEHSRAAFLWYLDLAKPIGTSPHVIAEIHGLVKSRLKWKGNRLESFWKYAQKELSRLGLQEELVKVTEMEPKALGGFGPTDAAILALAKMWNAIVLTADRRLRSECAGQEISVLSYSEVLDKWLENQV